MNILNNVGVGVSSTSAFIHIKSSPGSAGSAPLKFTTGGILLSTPENGSIEVDPSNNLFYTNNSGVRARKGMWAYNAITANYTALDGDYTLDCTGSITIT